MSTFLIQPSFAAGELSPLLFARVDLEKYHSGAALMRNFFVDYRGGASTRMGTDFIDFALHSDQGQPRLIPFIVSSEIAYMLEFGNFYVRFIANGGYVIDGGTGLPLIVASPYAVADLPLLKFAQSANLLTLTHPSYPIYNLTRITSTYFSLTINTIDPDIGTPGGVVISQKNNTDTKSRYGYVITAVGANGKEGLPSDPVYVDGSILNQNTGIVNDVNWDIVAGGQYYNIYKSGPTPTNAAGITSSAASVSFGYVGSSPFGNFVDNNIAPDYSSSPPQFQDPFSPGELTDLAVTARGSGYTGALTPLTFTGGGGTGAAGFGIIDDSSAGVVGAVLTRPGKNYTTLPTISDAGGNTATYTVSLGQLNGTYPGTVGYVQQRRTFGGTTNLPEALVASQPGDYNNFNTHPISLATDSITASLAGLQVNAIKALVPVSTGLIVLTSGSGFLVTGGSQGSAITPTDLVALPQASSGVNDMPPLIVTKDILYVQNRGSVVRDLAFNFYIQAYDGTDRSVLASHLFSGYKLTEWAYAEEPFRLITAVRNDGRLLTFTYVPEQEIFAWASFTTNGLFRSVASIPEGTENAIYTIIQRFNGISWVYYVERFASRVFNTLADAQCLDSALQLPLTYPAATIQMSAISGNAVAVSASTAVFSAGDVGKVLWANTGKATMVAYVSPVLVSINIAVPFEGLPDDPNNTPIYIDPGDWSLDTPVSTVSGLAHLEGKLVAALADGQVVNNLTVTGGSVTLPTPATKVNVGLPFMCQLQTLRIDVGEPTIQGKRKLITGVTARVVDTIGLLAGEDFDNLFAMEGVPGQYVEGELQTGDINSLIRSDWTSEGQVCFQQSNPLPATICGIIPEVTIGDTQR